MEKIGPKDFEIDLSNLDFKKDPMDISAIDEYFPPWVSDEEVKTIEKFFSEHPEFKSSPVPEKRTPDYTIGSEGFDPSEPWFQTFSGKRFTPLKPNPDSVVIQDVARGLSMQCRFTGHVKSFYSVAQHSVLVSHLCDWKDRLWGLLHDASEAYICDFSRPLKHSGKFENYLAVEKDLMDAICKRFGLPLEEPESVKRADKIILATEARDVVNTRRPDWPIKIKPIPFTIVPVSPEEAEKLFLDRFYELINE